MEPVFVINLSHRKDRWRSMLRQLNSANVHRWPAVNGKQLSTFHKRLFLSKRVQFDIEHGNDESYVGIRSLGAAGCFLSHACIWAHMVKNDISVALVMEDDCSLPEDWWATVNRHRNSAVSEETWDLLFEGYHWTYGKKQKAGPLFRLRGGIAGTQSYWVTRRGAERLLRRVFPLEVPIDNWINVWNTLYPDDLVIYVPPKRAFGNKWSDMFSSDIGSFHIKPMLPSSNWFYAVFLAVFGAVVAAFAFWLGRKRKIK